MSKLHLLMDIHSLLEAGLVTQKAAEKQNVVYFNRKFEALSENSRTLWGNV